LQLSKWSEFDDYLTYHEDRAGCEKINFNKKPWLKDAAKKIKKKTSIDHRQLKGCKAKLDDKVDSWF
jgi:hypothetical protein|tara:strand:- start:877 stop:1077 length:201 start_codon:yes stop_codon:yes gene_type:complete